MSNIPPAGGTLLLSVLVGFWLAGLVLLRSELWLPWISLLAALAAWCWFARA